MSNNIRPFPALDELVSALAAEGYPITREQAQSIANLVQQAGGVEEALNAVDALSELKRAA